VTSERAKTLYEELKQNKPFKSLEEEALLSIVRTAALLDHSFAKALEPFDLTPTQYNVLRILRGSPDGLCRNEVGERLVTNVPDVTRLLDRMERCGLIQRQRNGKDRRYVTTRITDKGMKLVDRLDRELTAIHSRQIGHLGEKKTRELIKLLSEARARL
jgi:DNA-binding MarR family transcriptional regulator